MKRKVVAFMLIMAVCANLHTTVFAARNSEWTEEETDSMWQPVEGGTVTGGASDTILNDIIAISGGGFITTEDSTEENDIADVFQPDTSEDSTTTTIESQPINTEKIVTAPDETETTTEEETTVDAGFTTSGGSTTTTVVEEEKTNTDKSEYIPKVVFTEGSGEFVDTGKKDENGKPILEWRDTTKEKQDKKEDDKKSTEEQKKAERNAKIQQELKDYAASLGFKDNRRFNKTLNHEYAEEPVIGETSCEAGKLADSTLKEGLDLINMIRKTAGLGEVTLDDTYNEYAQNGALIMKASEGTIINGIDFGGLSHNPIKADNTTKEQQDLGHKGTRNGNIGKGHASLTESILNGYMYDGDRSNIAAMGHRRWILNPTMGKVGFGQVEDYNCMYAHDMSVNSKIEDFITWPAENTPVELMPYSYDKNKLLNVETNKLDDRSRIVSELNTPWTCQLGKNYKIVPTSQLTITVTYPDGHEYIVPQDNIYCNDENYGCAVPVFQKNGELYSLGTRGRGCITFCAKDPAAERVLLNEKIERFEQEKDKMLEDDRRYKYTGGLLADSSPKVGYEDFGSNYKVKIEGVRDSKTGEATTIEYDVNFFELGL